MKISLIENENEIRAGYKRVTDILSPLNQFIGVDKNILKVAADRGTEIHKAIQMDSQDLCYRLKPEHRGYFRSYLKWKAVTQYKIFKSELRLYDDELKITGGLDAIVTHDDERFYLADWKNTVVQNRDYWELQGMFYHYLASKNGIKLQSKIMFIQLCPNGSAPKVFSFDTSEVLWRQCLKYYYLAHSEKSISIKSPF